MENIGFEPFFKEREWEWVALEFGLGALFIDTGADRGAIRRAAARACLFRLTEGREREPAKNERGAPVSPYGHLSLSHTRGGAAAAFHPSARVGVDVERLDPKRVSPVYQKFMSPDEQRRFEAAPSVEFFFSVWSVKEAMFKIANAFIEEVSFRRELMVEPGFYDAGRGIGVVERPGFRMELELYRTFYGDYVFCGAIGR